MPSRDVLSQALDSDIAAAHDRFVAAMSKRLPAMSLETKERYFAVLSALVSKLEAGDKHFRDIAQEMVAETAGYLMQELGGAR